MKLTNHLPRKLIKVPLEAADKTEAITALVDHLVESGTTEKRDLLLQAVLDREAQRSTGIGHGFAIPHAKCDAVKELVIVFGRPVKPIDFAAVDNLPINLIALLVSPTNATSTHIQALATLSRMVKNEKVLNGLIEAENADEFYRIIVDNENESTTA
ncbi:MAG: PTS sugar transporter subunit IIA [Phycisphaerae bacterium]